MRSFGMALCITFLALKMKKKGERKSEEQYSHEFFEAGRRLKYSQKSLNTAMKSGSFHPLEVTYVLSNRYQ